jgi:hypothetical protein
VGAVMEQEPLTLTRLLLAPGVASPNGVALAVDRVAGRVALWVVRTLARGVWALVSAAVPRHTRKLRRTLVGGAIDDGSENAPLVPELAALSRGPWDPRRTCARRR